MTPGMSLRRLAALLEREVPRPPRPKQWLEQYRTPPEVALEMATRLPGCCRVVLDLGSGTGMIAYAASLLRGDYVVAVDIDAEQLEAARGSSLHARLLVDHVQADAASLPLRPARGLCVAQNPPFGTKRRGADRVFVEAAASLGAEAIESLHLYSDAARGFLEKLYRGLGYDIAAVDALRFPIPAMYRGHVKRVHYALVLLVSARRRGARC